MADKISETELIINRDGSIYHLNLKPRHIADIVLTVGDPGRVHKITQHFDEVEFEMNKREFITHLGTYKGKKITVISTGMGTDNIEVLLTELDALVNIDFKKRLPKAKQRRLSIIRIGTSGSIQEDLRLGSHIMSEYAVGMDSLMHYYDLEMSPFEMDISTSIQESIGLDFAPYCVRASEKLLTIFKDAFKAGNTVTCPGFYAPQGRSVRNPIKYPNLADKLNYFHKDNFWLTNLEMETAGYYALGRLLGHDIVSLNAILANRIKGKFSKDPNKVIDQLIKKTLDIVVEKL